MGNYIAGFYKSEHFYYRQWDIKITDQFLEKILKNIETNNDNTLLIVSRQILKKDNKKSDEQLFIKVDENLLITCFYGKLQEYFI